MYYIVLVILASLAVVLLYKKFPKTAILCFVLVLFVPLYHTYYDFFHKKSLQKYNIKVSSYDYSSPWLVLKSDGIVSGIDINLLGSFATAVKLSMDFIERGKLGDKEPDILIGGIYKEYVQDNKNMILSEPYGQETMVVLGPYHLYNKKNVQSKEAAVSVMQGKKLGTLASNRYKIVLEQINIPKGADVRYYNTLMQLLEDYSKSKVDLMLVSTCLQNSIKNTSLSGNLVTVYTHTPNNLYVAFNKNSSNYLKNVSYFNAMIGERNKLIVCK